MKVEESQKLTDWKSLPMIQKLRRNIFDVFNQLLDFSWRSDEIYLKLYWFLFRPKETVWTREILILMAMRQLNVRHRVLFCVQFQFHCNFCSSKFLFQCFFACRDGS